MDQKLRGIAARRAALDAEEANLLRYAEELKLWRGWGFGSMLEYMERAMGYAPHTAAERLRVARAIAELPLIAEALEQGALAHSAVRELSRVAIPDTEAAWLDAARGKNLREIEALVSGHRPGHLPSDETEPRFQRRTITLEVSPETYDIWRRMHALAAEEHGQRLSDDELISSVFRRAYGDERAHAGSNASGSDKASSPAYKIAIKQCPDCKRAWQYSGGRDIEIDPTVAECAACDAVHLGSLDAAAPERTTTTVTPRKREQVLARDGHCCTVPGCRRNVELDLHHIEYQSRGGNHELSNLTTICDLHHRAVHSGKLVIRGSAPDRITFEFRKPRDRRNVTDDDARDSPGPRNSTANASLSPARAASSRQHLTDLSHVGAAAAATDPAATAQSHGGAAAAATAPATTAQSHGGAAAADTKSAATAQSHGGAVAAISAPAATAQSHGGVAAADTKSAATAQFHGGAATAATDPATTAQSHGGDAASGAARGCGDCNFTTRTLPNEGE